MQHMSKINHLQIGFACMLLMTVSLGILGIKDSHNCKLPLSIIAGILGCACSNRYYNYKK